MGKTAKWFRTPKATPLQLLILFIGIYYALYTITELLDEIPDLIQVLIYGVVIMFSILAGASLIDWRKMGYRIRRIARDKNLEESERLDQILDVVDEALYHADKIVKKKKSKGGKKKNG